MYLYYGLSSRVSFLEVHIMIDIHTTVKVDAGNKFRDL